MKGLIDLLLVGLLLACIFVSKSIAEEYVQTDEHYIQDREQLAEVIRDLDLDEADSIEILHYVVDEGNEMSAESLRDSGISDEAWERIQDDARMD